MTVEERRRIALHRAAAGTWGEEVADTLVELVAPSGHELATRADIEGTHAAIEATRADIEATRADVEATRADVEATRADIAALDRRVDERFAEMDARWDARLTAMDERWDTRLEALGHRLTATFERRIADAITSQTRTLVLSQLAALVVIAGLAFGLR
jgi:hypothetical protein